MNRGCLVGVDYELERLSRPSLSTDEVELDVVNSSVLGSWLECKEYLDSLLVSR